MPKVSHALHSVLIANTQLHNIPAGDLLRQVEAAQQRIQCLECDAERSLNCLYSLPGCDPHRIL